MVATNQHELLSLLRDEVAQLRAELAQLRSGVERILVENWTRPIESPPRTERPALSAPDRSASPREKREAVHSRVTHDVAVPQAPMDPVAYARLITRIRSLVRTVVPFNAVVAVVSRGDEALVELEGRIAWHFPRLEDGRWLGHHPQDSREAIAHLERLRRQGARYLLFPSTSLWWLTHYDEFARHLESNSTPLARHDDACRIFALQPQESR